MYIHANIHAVMFTTKCNRIRPCIYISLPIYIHLYTYIHGYIYIYTHTHTFDQHVHMHFVDLFLGKNVLRVEISLFLRKLPLGQKRLDDMKGYSVLDHECGGPPTLGWLRLVCSIKL